MKVHKELSAKRKRSAVRCGAAMQVNGGKYRLVDNYQHFHYVRHAAIIC